MQEIWKNVPGYNNLYQVSTYGNVRRWKYSKKRWKYIKPGHTKEGYLTAVLSINSCNKTFKIHRLVAIVFIPIPKELLDQRYTYETLCVNHKDEDKANNHVENLEWCTREYNNNYGTRNIRLSKPVTQFDLEGNWIKNWNGLSEAARYIGIPISDISACCMLKAYTAGNFIWRYTLPEYKEGYKLDISNINTTKKLLIKSITQFDITGTWIRNWLGGAREIEKELHINAQLIRWCCRQKYHTAAGYIWKYTLPEYKEGYKLDVPIIRSKSINITQFTLEGDFVKNWKHGLDIERTLGYSSSSIYKCCQGIRYTAYNHIWLYTKLEYKEGYNLFNIDMEDALNHKVQKIDIKTNEILGAYENSFIAFKSLSSLKININGWVKIYLCCQNKLPLIYGYKWQFYSDIH